MARSARGSGRPLEAAGNGGPRWMITAAGKTPGNRIRLTGRLSPFCPDLREHSASRVAEIRGKISRIGVREGR